MPKPLHKRACVSEQLRNPSDPANAAAALLAACRVVPRRTLDDMRREGWVALEDFAAAAGLSRSAARKHLFVAVDAGRAERAQAVRGTSLYTVYRVRQ